jgi:hypothetical protein
LLVPKEFKRAVEGGPIQVERHRGWLPAEVVFLLAVLCGCGGMTDTSRTAVNSIRFADQYAGADFGAKINAADTNLGSANNGTIVVRGNQTATTQITVRPRHTLRVEGALGISQPILMSDGAAIQCNTSRGSGGDSLNIGGIYARAPMSSMVRGLTQDGTTEMFTVIGCGFDGGYQPITNGVIDLTGMNDRTTIRDLEIIHFNDGACVYVGNAPVNSTSFQKIENIWCGATGGVGHNESCLKIVATGTNQGTINNLEINGFECGDATAAYPILIQDSSTGPVNTIYQLYLNNITFISVNATSAIRIDKAWMVSIDHVSCATTLTNCVDVSSNTGNQGIVVHHIFGALNGSVNLILDGLNSVTIPGAGRTGLETYSFYNPSSPGNFTAMGFLNSLSETTVPPTFTGTGVDTCYGDSTTHGVKCSFNNDTFGLLARTNAAQTWSGNQANMTLVAPTLSGAVTPSTMRFKLTDQGQCTMASGTCTAQHFGSTYSAAPLCFANWTGTGVLTGLIKVPTTTTTVTPASSVNTDTARVNWACFGN